MKPVRKAVFPVAGLGTRFLPATKAMPKEMLPVVDRPLIQHVVDEAREAGIEHFIFVTGRNKGVIEDHFDRQFELEMTLLERQKHDALKFLTEELPIEMILDDAFVAAGDEDEMLDAGLAGLVDDVLDQRPVDHRQHFLRHRLGGRQEPGAEPGNGEDGFADEFHVLSCGGRGQMLGAIRFLAQFIVQVSLKVSESQDRSTIGVILARS